MLSPRPCINTTLLFGKRIVTQTMTSPSHMREREGRERVREREGRERGREGERERLNEE